MRHLAMTQRRKLIRPQSASKTKHSALNNAA